MAKSRMDLAITKTQNYQASQTLLYSPARLSYEANLCSAAFDISIIHSITGSYDK